MIKTDYDVVIVGGGPAGATAANDLAKANYRVLLIERGFRIKPCGGAIPPCLIDEFDIDLEQLVCKVSSARMISPKGTQVDMPIDGTFVGMVDRQHFDPWLRQRASDSGAELVAGKFLSLSYADDNSIQLRYQRKDKNQHADSDEITVTTRTVIGADGARSAVARQHIPCSKDLKWVFAYHEIVKAPTHQHESYDPERCEVWYQGRISPDFYGWVFPHGACASIGAGSGLKSYDAKASVKALRDSAGLSDAKTLRKEGAPLPLKPLKRWDDGRGVLLAGDAAGVVAPSSGEGIYYAMLSGRLAGQAVTQFMQSGAPADLAMARKRFLKLHGRTFWVLGVLQRIWYRNDKRREQFVAMCRDRDVQELTWQAYTQKKLVRKRFSAHVRVVFKDIAQLLGIAKAA